MGAESAAKLQNTWPRQLASQTTSFVMHGPHGHKLEPLVAHSPKALVCLLVLVQDSTSNLRPSLKTGRYGHRFNFASFVVIFGDVIYNDSFNESFDRARGAGP